MVIGVRKCSLAESMSGMRLRPGNPKEVGMSVQRVQHVVDLAEGWVAQDITPSLVILIARRGVIVIHEAFGRLTPEQDSPPLKLDTIFPLASLTKPMTATAAMILVEDGLLGLNRPVSWYIPEFVGEGKNAVMVHHLLTHTSGLKNEDVDAHAEKKVNIEIPPPDKTQHPFLNEYLFLRYDAPLWKPPGVEMSYCDDGYNLVAEIVRRVSGKSFNDFMTERLFRPLGMKDTTCIVPDSLRHRVVRRPQDAPFAWLDTQENQETPWASGGFSTAIDTAVFGQMFLNRGIYGDTTILSPVSVTEMTRNQIPGISARYEDEFFPEASWGVGWNVHGNKKALNDGSLHSSKTFDHGGVGGVFLWVDPIYEIVGLYFFVEVNTGVNCVDLFMNAVTAAVIDE